jgi:hypothetical protein
MKRNYKQAELFDDFSVYLDYAVEHVCCQTDCHEWLKVCKYLLK